MGRNWQEPMQWLRMMLNRLKACGIYAATHRVRSLRREIRWRGRQARDSFRSVDGDRAAAWEAATERVAEAVPLHHPREDRQVLIFLILRDRFEGSCVTGDAGRDERKRARGEVSHEALAFLSGTFKGS